MHEQDLSSTSNAVQYRRLNLYSAGHYIKANILLVRLINESLFVTQ